MWDAWSDVANNPQLPRRTRRADPAEQHGRGRAQLCARGARRASGSQNRKQLAAYADEVNTAAETIAQLNDSIVQAKATGVIGERTGGPARPAGHEPRPSSPAPPRRCGRTAPWTCSSATPHWSVSSPPASSRSPAPRARRPDGRSGDAAVDRHQDRGRRRRHHGRDGRHADHHHPGHLRRRSTRWPRRWPTRSTRRTPRATARTAAPDLDFFDTATTGRDDQGGHHRPGQGRHLDDDRHDRRLGRLAIADALGRRDRPARPPGRRRTCSTRR